MLPAPHPRHRCVLEGNSMGPLKLTREEGGLTASEGLKQRLEAEGVNWLLAARAPLHWATHVCTRHIAQ